MEEQDVVLIFFLELKISRGIHQNSTEWLASVNIFLVEMTLWLF